MEEGYFIKVVGCLQKGSENASSLIMHGFWNNPLYSASITFKVIFLLSPFYTRNCYYLKSNLSLVLLLKVFLTENIM